MRRSVLELVRSSAYYHPRVAPRITGGMAVWPGFIPTYAEPVALDTFTPPHRKVRRGKFKGYMR